MTVVPLAAAPISGALGARIDALDLSGGLAPGAAAALRQAVAEHLVVMLPDQDLSPARLVEITAALGPVARVPYIRQMPDQPDVIEVRKSADEQRISVFGGDWHSDFSFLPEPPSLTLLYAIEVPPSGGDTIWSNMQLAFAALSSGLQATLRGLKALHSGHVYGAARPPTEIRTSRSIGISRNNPEADREIAHPVVRRHPVTGREALFINPIYTTRFENMTEAESRPLLQYLYQHAARPELTCRLHWQAGALALWDNRATLHYAVNDYDGFDRLLWRTTVAGETPIGAGA